MAPTQQRENNRQITNLEWKFDIKTDHLMFHCLKLRVLGTNYLAAGSNMGMLKIHRKLRYLSMQKGQVSVFLHK